MLDTVDVVTVCVCVCISLCFDTIDIGVAFSRSFANVIEQAPRCEVLHEECLRRDAPLAHHQRFDFQR